MRQRFHFEIPGESLLFEQPLDHFDSHSNETYNQRYFVNLNYTDNKNVTNIIVYIGGEAELSESKITTGAVTTLAAKTNAVLLALEHRFFGKSYPNLELTTETYRYLTISQALEDLNAFINFSTTKYCTDPEHCTVAVVGGSYPGSLSSWMRLKYPSVVAASWASSAPVLVIDDFYQYDEHVNSMLIKIKGQECRDNLQRIYQTIGASLSDESQRAEIVEKLGFDADQTDVSILYVIADSVAGPIQYKKWQYLLDNLCDSIKSGRWQDFAEPFRSINNVTGQTPQSMDLMTFTNTSLESPDRDMRSWTWMTCNEVGWFQTAGKDPDTALRNSRVDMNYFDEVCVKLFGVHHADPKFVDLRYGSNNPQSTNVFFVNGETDPWSELSVKVADSRLDRHAAVAKKGAHCTELQAETKDDDSNLKQVRKRVIEQMQKWMERSDFGVDLCKNGGVRVMTKCQCPKGWGGYDCSVSTVKYTHFKTITIGAVAVTTALLLILGVFIWLCGKREESEFGARPTLYTN